jgi:predicted GNAT family N-acyltransferase
MTDPTIIPYGDGVRYGCPYCQWDTADETTAREHIQWRHRKATPIIATAATKPKRKAQSEPPTDWSEVGTYALEDDGSVRKIEE